MTTTSKYFSSEEPATAMFEGMRLTDCCGKFSTYYDADLCCKGCHEAVPIGQGDGTEFRPAVGIPYAEQDVDESGQQLALCPECQTWIPLNEMKDGESFTGREYQEHYATEHAR